MAYLQTVYFVEIYDHHDNRIELMGPFNSENNAHESAWSKWEGDDSVKGSRILTDEEINWSETKWI